MINKYVNLLRKHDLWNYELYNLTTTNQVLDFLKKNARDTIEMVFCPSVSSNLLPDDYKKTGNVLLWGGLLLICTLAPRAHFIRWSIWEGWTGRFSYWEEEVKKN